MGRKVLADSLKEQFKQDWISLSLRQLENKYKSAEATLRKWAKELGCPQARPRIFPGNVTSVQTVAPPETEILTQQEKQKTAKIDISKEPMVQELLAKIREVGHSAIPDKEKQARLVELSNEIFVEYVNNSPNGDSLIENMTLFRKLLTYEMQIKNQSKETEQLSREQLEELKKGHIQEALDDIASYLTPMEQQFFQTLIKLATQRALAERRKQTEAQQQAMIEAGAVEEAELVQ